MLIPSNIASSEADNVFGLLTNLSEVIARSDRTALSGKELISFVNKVRSSMYSILLGKKCVQEISALSNEVNRMSPLSWLIAQRFTLNRSSKERESCELDDAIKKAVSLGWDESPPPILRTLICLANTSCVSSEDAVPLEPFALSHQLGLTRVHTGKSKFTEPLLQSRRIYPALSEDVFKPPPWMRGYHSFSPFGNYVTSFPFNEKPGTDLPLLGSLNEDPLERNDLGRPLYQLHPVPALTGPKQLTLASNGNQPHLEDEGYFTPMTDVGNEIHRQPQSAFEDQTKVWSDALQVSLPALKSWETIGNRITHPEPPFLSSAGPYALLHLSTLMNMYQDVFNASHSCDPEPTSRVDFVRGILLLMTGIESTNFPYDKDSNTFRVREGMWLEGYSMNGTHDLCQDFLFCGTYFRLLEKLAHSCSSNTDTIGKHGGIMVQSLIGCVQRWTQFYRGAVLIISSNCQSQGNLILLHELLDHIQPLKQQITCLSSLCCVESSKNGDLVLPSGVSLLAHIYREACNKSDSQQSHLLYSALKSCCEVYLQCIQKWIFLGYCSDEESDEFFVHKDPLFSTKQDRSFWVRGFILDKESVPVFLQGLEIAVFDCGRAMNLLKLCNPQHPLCALLEKQHPTIYCCLFKSDMEKVHKECAQFEEDAQRVCGEFVNVASLLEKEQAHEANLHILVQEAQKKRDIARTSLRIQLEKERAKIKEKQNADLKAQIFEIQKRKAAEKEQQQLEDELYLKECQRQETAVRQLQEKERQKVLAHYEELGKIVDKQNQHREWQMKRLKLADKRQTFLYEDSLNLSRDCQLLKTCSATVTGLDDVDDVISAEQSPSLITLHNETESQGPSPSLVLKCASEAKHCPNNLQVCDAQDAFKEASVLKAKVLQIEYGLGPEKPVIETGRPPTSGIGSKIGDESMPLIESIAQSKPTKEECELQTQINMQSCSTHITGVNTNLNSPTKLEKNRKKVLTEDECWHNLDVSKETSVDSGIVLERERNRNRILGGEYNIITGCKVTDCITDSSCIERSQRDWSVLSDLQKNRRKVLNEDYNTLTGEKSLKPVTATSDTATHADSGIDVQNTTSTSMMKINSNPVVAILPSSSSDSLHSCLMSGSRELIGSYEEDASSRHVVFERPCLLSVSSDPSVIVSPLMTPQGLIDVPVFTSPFKGTNNLPNGLPLASPQGIFAAENVTCSDVNGSPLMVDIADNFCAQFDSHLCDSDSVDNHYEVPRTTPNTSWLESSLQTCLLLPLRVQYRHVSSALLHFFLVDLKLLTHLKSLRSYYLMQDGEFGRNLTVKLFPQMYQVVTPEKLLNALTLDKIMKEALASSLGTTDPNHRKLCLRASHVPDHFSHSSPNVLDCLQLSYKVKWPLNLLLTPETFEKYNLIFLFLVRLKRVAWLLQEDFVALKNTARGCFKEQNRDLLNSPQYHQVQMIRHNMSQFVQATLNYVSSCVLHASWSDFAMSLKQATTIDHIYNAHIEYIKRLLKRCLLNNKSQRVEVVLSKILRCIIKFHSNMRVRPWQVPRTHHNQQAHSTYLEHPNFQQLVACSTHFKLQVSKLVSYLERLISPPNQQQHLTEYLFMLNVNGFYKSTDYLKHAENVQESYGKTALSIQSIS